MDISNKEYYVNKLDCGHEMYTTQFIFKDNDFIILKVHEFNGDFEYFSICNSNNPFDVNSNNILCNRSVDDISYYKENIIMLIKCLLEYNIINSTCIKKIIEDIFKDSENNIISIYENVIYSIGKKCVICEKKRQCYVLLELS